MKNSEVMPHTSANTSSVIDGVIVYDLDTFHDCRGEIWTVYSANHFHGQYVQDKVTISYKDVLRGFHGDAETAKLITCLSGSIQFAMVDLRQSSPTYGKSEVLYLDDQSPRVVYVPAGCVNAHLCLSDKCVFYYKWSHSYKGPDAQITIAWDDPDINVPWATLNPILSERDKLGKSFQGVQLYTT
jgi:dTDP-4-dehydrorhamnose 3,5-epimerase